MTTQELLDTIIPELIEAYVCTAAGKQGIFNSDERYQPARLYDGPAVHLPIPNKLMLGVDEDVLLNSLLDLPCVLSVESSMQNANCGAIYDGDNNLLFDAKAQDMVILRVVFRSLYEVLTGRQPHDDQTSEGRLPAGVS